MMMSEGLRVWLFVSSVTWLSSQLNIFLHRDEAAHSGTVSDSVDVGQQPRRHSAVFFFFFFHLAAVYQSFHPSISDHCLQLMAQCTNHETAVNQVMGKRVLLPSTG